MQATGNVKGIGKNLSAIPPLTPKDFLDEQESFVNHGELTGKQLILDAPEQMEYVLEQLFPRSGMGALAGGSDLGKSTLLRQLAITLVCGFSKFLGFDLTPVHRSAIVVCSEDDRNAISYLLKAQTKDIEPEKLDSLRFIFDWENLLIELELRLKNKPADLIIVDCFADVFGGDLKDTQKIRTFLSGYKQLCDKYNCFILWLHHTGKRTENFEPSKNNLLAGQGFEAKMRVVIELRADPMNVSHRHFCIVKGNYIPRNMKTESYVLHFDEQHFNFSYTGERAPFELLVKQSEDPAKSKYDQAKELKDKGYSFERIAEQLGFANKSSVSRLFDKAEKNKW